MPNRNLDRVLAPSFMDGVERWTITELRTARTEVQLLEDAISMLRRLVQGRLDIIGAELHWRTTGSGAREIVDSLKASLTDHGPSHSSNGRFTAPLAPAESQANWALHRADSAMLGHDIAGVPDLDDETLHTLADGLHSLERTVSSERRSLHDRLDAIQSQIVQRYKSGEATVEGLLQ
jgi:hypothetical protein